MLKKLIEKEVIVTLIMKKNENIFIHIVIARIAYLFEIGEINNIEKWIKILNQIKISNNQIYEEKLCVKFFNEVNELSPRISWKNYKRQNIYISILEDLEDKKILTFTKNIRQFSRK